MERCLINPFALKNKNVQGDLIDPFALKNKNVQHDLIDPFAAKEKSADRCLVDPFEANNRNCERRLLELIGLRKKESRVTKRPKTVRLALETLESRITPTSLHADFNNDGYDDLAIGMPEASNGGNDFNGAVQVIYGSPSGLQDVKTHFLRHTSSSADLLFGFALASGDFDGDGFDDLAVGSPNKDLPTIADAGSVTIFYGTTKGVDGNIRQEIHEDTNGVPGAAQTADLFGYAMTAGDFNGDGRDDLAIGVPNDGQLITGGVNVLFGSADGIVTTGAVKLTQGSNGVLDLAEFTDGFGSALAAGDFNGDGRDDLAIGVPYEELSGQEEAGCVNIVYGAANGFATSGNQFWSQNSSGIADSVEAGDHFGFVLAAGDFNHDGRDDLAIGAPEEDLGSFSDAGAVHIVFGSGQGLTSSGSAFLNQNTLFVPDDNEAGDHFGFALATGDFDGNGADDLAIGVPGENQGRGAVTLAISGLGGGFEFRSVSQTNDGTNATIANNGDKFGFALSAGDFDGDGRDDLAVGIPFKDVAGYADSGQVEALYFDSQFDIDFVQTWDWTNIGAAWGVNNRAGKSFGLSL